MAISHLERIPKPSFDNLPASDALECDDYLLAVLENDGCRGDKLHRHYDAYV